MIITAIVAVLLVASAIAMMALILLHSGRGTGLSDLFGGVSAAASGSTVAERNLTRLTIIAAVTFGFSALVLAIRLQ